MIMFRYARHLRLRIRPQYPVTGSLFDKHRSCTNNAQQRHRTRIEILTNRTGTLQFLLPLQCLLDQRAETHLSRHQLVDLPMSCLQDPTRSLRGRDSPSDLALNALSTMVPTVVMTVGFRQAIMDVWIVLVIHHASVKLLQAAVDVLFLAAGLPNA
jgi:hypothetical protein